jgi:hypothetical protein
MSPTDEPILTPNEYGHVVKEVNGLFVEVVPMTFNYRLHTRTEHGWSIRYWCYEGKSQQSFMAAVLAAHVWDGSDMTEPLGWIKSWDGRYSNPGIGQRGIDGERH